MNEEQIRMIIRDELGGLIKSDRYTIARTLQILDGRNIICGRSNGTKLATEITQKLGFFAKAPISQQTTTSQTPSTFSAGTSLIANDTATWDGYTIGDIVAILRAFGLIA